MRRRLGVVLGIALAVLIVAVTAQAQVPPRVRVFLGSPYIEGQGWGNALDVKATLRGPAGEVKGACWVRTWTDGGFSCSWGQGGPFSLGLLPPAANEPGDEVTVEHEGSTYASGPLADLRLENLDPVADRVTGSVVPRREKVRITGLRYSRLTPAGYRPAPAYVKVAVTDAAGAFDVDLTAEGNPIRNDTVFVGAVQGRFEVGTFGSFPGLDIQKDSNYGYLSGVPGTTHAVRLHGPGGVLKGETEVALGAGLFLSAGVARQQVAKAEISRGAAGAFSFEDGAGRPVRILEGDVIAVGGPGAFTFRVPKLSPGMGGSRFAVRTLPNRPIYLSGRILTSSTSSLYYDQYGKTDAAGLYQYDATPTAITPYSSCRFTTTIDGNYVSTSRTLAP